MWNFYGLKMKMIYVFSGQKYHGAMSKQMQKFSKFSLFSTETATWEGEMCVLLPIFCASAAVTASLIT